MDLKIQREWSILEPRFHVPRNKNFTGSSQVSSKFLACFGFHCSLGFLYSCTFRFLSKIPRGYYAFAESYPWLVLLYISLTSPWRISFFLSVVNITFPQILSTPIVILMFAASSTHHPTLEAKLLGKTWPKRLFEEKNNSFLVFFVSLLVTWIIIFSFTWYPLSVTQKEISIKQRSLAFYWLTPYKKAFILEF
mgnify:CR=1 FL=1